MFIFIFILHAIFNNHYSFYVSSLGMNYTNVIGFVIFVVYVLQFMSGLLLSCYYSPMDSFSSVYYIMIDVVVGWLIRLLHILGASLFMILVVFHWVSGIWLSLSIIDFLLISHYSIVSHMSNSFMMSFNFIWVSGILILIFTFLSSFIGYICIWGQMSYWGITVMINILSIIPYVGIYIGEYLWISVNVLSTKVFIVHFLLGVLIGVLIIVHLLILHSISSFNPFINSMSYVFSFYYLFFKDLFVCLVVSILITFFLTVDPDLLGNPDNLVKANPLSTPNHILPEWYFNLFYCILRAFPNKAMGVIGVIMMFVFIVFFIG